MLDLDLAGDVAAAELERRQELLDQRIPRQPPVVDARDLSGTAKSAV